MADVRELLRQAAPEPVQPYDPDDVRRRAGRDRRRRTAAVGVGGLAAVAALAVAVSWFAPPRVVFGPADEGGPEMVAGQTRFVLHAWLDDGVDEEAYEDFASKVRELDGVSWVEVFSEMRLEFSGEESRDQDHAEVLIPRAELFENGEPDDQFLPSPLPPPPLSAGESASLWIHVEDLAALRAVRAWLEAQPEVAGVEIPECSEVHMSLHADVDTVRARLDSFGCENDTVVLAAGEVDGSAWVFVAAREQPRPGFAADRDEVVPGWCYGITWAQGSSRSCVYDEDDRGLLQLVRSHLSEAGSPEVLYGRVSPETALVEALEHGQVVASYTPLDGGPAGRFVFGFLPDDVDPDEVVARDVDGTELERAPTFPPPPPDFELDDSVPPMPPGPPPDPDVWAEPHWEEPETDLRRAPRP